MRPKGKARVWASDAVYPAGANTWNGNANKSDPGNTATAQGYQPARQPPAQELNHVWNDATARIAYLDLIDCLNWSAPVSDGIYVIGPGQGQLCWDSYARRAWAVGLDSASRGDVWFSFNGLNWSIETIGIGINPSFASVASDPTDGSVWIASDSAPKLYFLSDPVGTWVVYTISATSFELVAWDDYEAGLVLMGKTAAGHPGIWTGLGPTPTAATVGNAASYTGSMRLAAFGPGLKLAIGTTPGLAGEHLWTSAVLAGPWTDRGLVTVAVYPGIGTVFRAMAYGPADGVFMIVLGGSTGDTVHTSSDGVSWAHRYTSNAWVFFSLVAQGGIWVAQIKDGNNVYGQALSVDGGVSWTQVPWSYSQSEVPAGLVVLDGRIGSLVENGGKVSYSLRTP
jgi:hypothetical protein